MRLKPRSMNLLIKFWVYHVIFIDSHSFHIWKNSKRSPSPEFFLRTIHIFLENRQKRALNSKISLTVVWEATIFVFQKIFAALPMVIFSLTALQGFLPNNLISEKSYDMVFAFCVIVEVILHLGSELTWCQVMGLKCFDKINDFDLIVFLIATMSKVYELLHLDFFSHFSIFCKNCIFFLFMLWF